MQLERIRREDDLPHQTISPPLITPDMRAVIQAAHLCFAATVTPEGRPSVSPKATLRVWDERHLFFLDIASPGTRRNLTEVPWIEINVVEPTSRRGYRFFGRATLHTEGPIFEKARDQVLGEEGAPYPVHAVVLVEVDRTDALISPGYLHVATEEEMRSQWRTRRTDLDREYEAYLRTAPPFAPPR